METAREIRQVDLPLLMRLCRDEVDADALTAQCLARRLPVAYWQGVSVAGGARLLGGHAARVWLSDVRPHATGSDPDEADAAEVLRAAHAWLDRQGVVWRQMLLRCDDARETWAFAAGYRPQGAVQLWERSIDSPMPVEGGAAEGPASPIDSRFQVVRGQPAAAEALFAQTLADSSEPSAADPRPPPQQWASLIVSARAPRLLRLEAAGKPAGCLLLQAPLPAEQWHIQYLGVTPPWRRQGAARRLLAAAAEQARTSLVETLTVSALAANQPANQLYASSGFEPVWRGMLWATAGQRRN